MKYFLLLLIIGILGGMSELNAQSKRSFAIKIKGQLNTYGVPEPLSGATVVILNTLDSSVVGSAVSNKEGVFLLENVLPGEYKLHVTHIGYDYIQRGLSITQNDTLVNLGIIELQKVGITLDGIEIVGKKPLVVVKVDTVEFNIKLLKVENEIVLEGMLRKLPGVEVEKDGTIKVNGEVIEKILVNGKPFLENDPKMITRNLRAALIEKVQFIDRNSDWSQFTRIDDIKKEKTVNIILKDEANGSYLARVNGAGGSDDRFSANASVNKFDRRQQLGGWVTATNISGYQDDGQQSKVAAGGNGNGCFFNVGENYNRDVSTKLKVGGNYSLSSNSSREKYTSNRTNILYDTAWYYYLNSEAKNKNRNHSLGLWVNFNPDTMYILNASVSFGYSVGNNVQDNTHSSFKENGDLVNHGQLGNVNSSSFSNLSISFSAGRRFRRAGRSLNFNIGIGYNENVEKEINKFKNLFVEPSGNLFSDSLDQQIGIVGLNRSVTMSLSYTEPIRKKNYLELGYVYSRSYGNSGKSVYDYDPLKDEYDRWNDSLSNTFDSKSSIQRLGIKFINRMTKYNYDIGLNIQVSSWDNNNISGNNQLSQYTVNFFPTAIFRYSVDARRRLQFSYLGSTQQPSLNQLQPVVDNDNPLYLQLGNPSLKSTFNNSFSIGYTSFNPDKMANFSAQLNSRLIANKIINDSWVDSNGRQISQPINIDGCFNVNVIANAGFPLKNYKASINANISLGFNRDLSYVNRVKLEARNFNVSSNFRLAYNLKDLLELTSSGGISLNRLQYIAGKANNAWLVNYRSSLDCGLLLPAGFSLGSSFEYMLNAGRGGFSSQEVGVLNIYFSKKIFKSKNALLRLQGLDLLNGNKGVSRVIGPNYIEEVQALVIQRLYLISVSYFFNNSKTK